ncbi:16S rRNA (adenine(1518)-N(6)/adenine(1519)-N(6))-dimethyltransferase RsmA [Halobacteriovorax sp. GB3]|uniref:16S rRNA (adenine(1518)-N(6)/adenine(1519)-N(6))- dimethyltransferase RsmA n=1 Tax=Halobacteriovorax sp. GB3 TaxID=2719615 RepID=UPI00235F493F|nr:16S rRNA (adenine(1518)-N(6)/adenine(1519)-N(6))-dimethyltransferase RsmA [Halobacteriovorax sp. GB3]MDD0851580.1 16S rRNA (adenine(1518)-N(6)/adenine(1519)-N(6))-dimethyltransferase RsmA [Halobacteriovorax sp. GB3]
MSERLPYANKDLGQHFLRDQKVITSITDDFKDKAKGIIEVGPGPGILTKNLSEHGLPFAVIEKDERFPEILEAFLASDRIRLTDALTVDLNEFIETMNLPTEDLWLVSNLPYNVGVPLLINFLQCDKIKYMTLMFQKEVADKVTPFMTKESKAMGSLMALSKNYFDVELLCKVPPGAFQPPPKVDSAVVTMTRKENPEVPLSEFRVFESFLRKLFAMKRKQLGKVLKGHYQSDKLESAFKACGIERTIRAEALSLESVINLYKELR